MKLLAFKCGLQPRNPQEAKLVNMVPVATKPCSWCDMDGSKPKALKAPLPGHQRRWRKQNPAMSDSDQLRNPKHTRSKEMPDIDTQFKGHNM